MGGIESKRITNCQRCIPVHVNYNDNGAPTSIREIIKSDVSPCVAEISDVKLMPEKPKSLFKVVKCQMRGCTYNGRLKKRKINMDTSDLDPLDGEPPFLIT